MQPKLNKANISQKIELGDLENEYQDLLHFDHIAYATKSTDSSIQSFSCICSIIDPYKKYEPSQNVYYSYLTNAKCTSKIELVEPAKGNNPVQRLLEHESCVIYHVGYRTDYFSKVSDRLFENNFFRLTKPFRPQAEPDILVCHFFNPASGIIEIMGTDSYK